MHHVNNSKSFTDIRNYLAGKAIGITRDTSLLNEVLKCLFCQVSFGAQREDNVKSTEEIAKLYREEFAIVKTKCPQAFAKDEEILLDPDSIFYVHSVLKNIDFLDAASDPLSDLYQTFAGTEMRGNEGQFFTPTQAVSWIVEALEPKVGEKIIDPACGAGSFLFNISRYLKRNNANDLEITSSIYGIEKDKYLANLADTHLALTALGQANIFCGDSIERKDDLDNALKIKFEDAFDVVVANPPFGAKIKVGSDKVKALYDLSRKWVRNKENGKFHRTENFVSNPTPQVLFLEICIKLLKPGGKLGIVVPESMLSNASSAHVVSYFMENMRLEAVIGMPENLFKTSGKGGTHTKTCLLIATKAKAANEVYDFFMAEAKWCGNDSRGNFIPHNDLPEILNRFKNFRNSGSLDEPSHLGYLVNSKDVKDFVLAPRYYDPRIYQTLQRLRETHNLVSLGQLVKDGVLEIRTGDEVGKLSYGTGDIPFVRTSDISNWEVKLDPKHGLSEEIYQQFASKQDVCENDILMVKDGTYLIGTCALITKFDTRIVYQSHLYKIRVLKEEILSPFVLLAALSSKPVIEQIQSKRFTQDIIDTLGKRINELVIPLPKNSEKIDYIHSIVKKSIADRVESRELARHAKIALIGD